MNGRQNRRPRVSVVIPAHNEEGNIEPLLEELFKINPLLSYQMEVVFVNDGSTDRTEQKMYESMRRYSWVKVVRNRVRQGLTSALAKGFANARGDILVFWPADLQFQPKDIPRMVEAIENGADMVCGKKVGRYGKWMVSWIYNLMTRILFPKLKVTDMNSVKAFTREVYNEFPSLREGWHRYLAVFAAAKDFVVREVPVQLHKRHSGKSKFSSKSRIMKGFTDLIAVKFQVSVFGDPMNLFGKVSLLFFLLGLGFAAAWIVDHFVYPPGIRTWIYGFIFCELAALLTFVMGIITESLVYLRDALTDVRAQNQKIIADLSRGGRGPRPTDAEEESRGELFEREERRERTDRFDRPDRRERAERPERNDRPERGDRRDRPERRGRENFRENRNRDREAERPRDLETANLSAEPTAMPEREPRRPESRGDRRRPDRRERFQRDRTPNKPDEERPQTMGDEPAAPAAPPEAVVMDQPAVVTETPRPIAEPGLFSENPAPETFSDSGSFQRRTGRRMRRVHPTRTAPAASESTVTPEQNAPASPTNGDVPERPLTLKVRELPPSTETESGGNDQSDTERGV